MTSKRDAYRQGLNDGHGLACHNIPRIGDRIDRSIDYVGIGDIVTAENIREYHELLCFAAEEHSRQYSPFEFTAHNFNEAGDRADGLWEAYDRGIAVAIRRDLRRYTDQDYGIEKA